MLRGARDARRRTRCARRLEIAACGAAVLAVGAVTTFVARRAGQLVRERAGSATDRRLRRDEPADVGVRRIALLRLERAREVLDGTGAAASVDALSEVMKLLAALALIDDRSAAPPLRAATNDVREAGMLLARLAENTAALRALDALTERFGAIAAGEAWRAEIETARARDADADERAPGELAAAVTALAAARAALVAWQPTDTGAGKHLRAGLARSYRAGRRAMRTVARDGSAARVEEWRRSAELFAHQLRLLRRLTAAAERRTSARAREVAELLRDHSDLELLRGELRVRPPIAEREALEALLDRRQAELLIRAFVLGGLLYARTPKAFRRALRRRATHGARR